MDVRTFFDGRTAAELRLWDALGADLLCPFHYFAVADGTDLRRRRLDPRSLRRGRAGERLHRQPCSCRHRARATARQGARPGSHARAGILRQRRARASSWRRRLQRGRRPRPSASAETTPPADRERALQDLANADVNALFAADLFNEGLDLPDVDTVLFLRPTESATLFLQQLGRGLRRTRDKAVLTVLDFVGHHRKEFRFDTQAAGAHRPDPPWARARHRTRLPVPAVGLPDRHGPTGAADRAGEHPQPGRQPLAGHRRRAALVRRPGPRDVPARVRAGTLRRAAAAANSWTQLRRDAGLPTRDGSELEAKLLKRVRAFAHVDDRPRCDATAGCWPTMRRRTPTSAPLNSGSRGCSSSRCGQMAVASRRTTTALPPPPRARRRATSSMPWSTWPSTAPATRRSPRDGPLRTCRYGSTPVPARRDPRRARLRQPRSQAEQRHAGSRLLRRALNVDAFFVTLKKSEADYSPTTMYRDYPISPTLFHWESQSTTSVASPTGQRYLNGSSTVLLVRARATEGRVRHRALPLPRPGALRLPYRRSPDRHHLAARSPHANRLLHRRDSRRRLALGSVPRRSNASLSSGLRR